MLGGGEEVTNSGSWSFCVPMTLSAHVVLLGLFGCVCALLQGVFRVSIPGPKFLPQ